MRKIKNSKRKLYSIINKSGLTTIAVGTSGVIASTLSEDINTTGVVTGLLVATVGAITHLIGHNKEYKNALKDNDLDIKRHNNFYRAALLREQEKLDKFEFYIDEIINKYEEEDRNLIKDDLFYDELLVERQLEVLDLDPEEEQDEIDEITEYIEYLESIEKSSIYLDLKRKFLHIGDKNNTCSFPNQDEEPKKIKKLSFPVKK